MTEDNAALATRLDSSLHDVSAEVNALRMELEDTNRHLEAIGEEEPQIQAKQQSPSYKAAVGTKKTSSVVTTYQEDLNQQAALQDYVALRDENLELTKALRSLRQELEQVRAGAKLTNATDESKVNELRLDLIHTQQELSRACEALGALKADRKKLKSEKLDLLSQMTQLYCTLEDKEAELRDFIRQFEQRMTDSTISMKQLVIDKEAAERDKWEMANEAREAKEAVISLRTQLTERDQRVTQLEAELRQVREKFFIQNLRPGSGGGGTGSGRQGPRQPRPHSMTPSSLRNLPDTTVLSVDDLPPPYRETPPPDQQPTSSQSCRSLDGTHSTLSSIGGEDSSSTENIHGVTMETSRSSGDVRNGIYLTITPNNEPRLETKKQRKSLGSWSKMFGGKSRSRRSVVVSDPVIGDDAVGARLSVLNVDNYADKLALLRQAQGRPIDTWKAGQVLAWLEIEMNMPMYAKACAENIKSGKVLVGLSESELESALGVTRPLHRRKLQLAIEYRKRPDLSPTGLNQLDHTWIAHHWLPDLGLPQHRDAFERNLVDGRLLNVLTRKEYEKHLGVTRKFHQVSLMHGVELLRKLGFDKENQTQNQFQQQQMYQNQAQPQPLMAPQKQLPAPGQSLKQRRSACEEGNVDPLVWSNSRVIKWVRTIDLQEYADQLYESGVHGAVLVLEPTFTSEAMASALGIPASKAYVRRHLASELELLVKAAKVSLDASNKKKSGSLGKSFVRSYRGGSAGSGEKDTSRGSGKKLAFRGSLGRALGKKVKAELAEDEVRTRASLGRLDPSKRSLSVDLDTTSV